jgi:excisionase family DNA binding protein
MQIELPDQVIDAVRDALTPVIDRLIDERVEQRRPLLLSVTQVADELSCSRASVFGLIHGGRLEAIRTGRTYRVATATLQQYVDELSRPSYERDIVSARRTRTRAPRQAGRGPSNSRQAPATSVLPATRPPRAPRPKQKKISKKEIADMRWTVAEFAERWWGMEAAAALLE